MPDTVVNTFIPSLPYEETANIILLFQEGKLRYREAK
jgi:hypothetical protein